MSQKTVLVVDDDPEIARLLRGYLRQVGYDVLVAHNGETAMHTIRVEKPVQWRGWAGPGNRARYRGGA